MRTHEAGVYVAAQPHPVAHVFGYPANEHQQQSLLHVFVAPDLWRYAPGKACVYILLVFQCLLTSIAP